jgi:hypothetical protein
MRHITIAIPDAAAATLAELARVHYRAPRQQAAALLVEAIECAALPQTDHAPSIAEAKPREAKDPRP